MKKILLIRFSSIGDIVLTTPAVRCLKKQTGAELHYLTKEQYLPLLEANPYLTKIFTIKKKVGEVLPELRKEGYDYIIDLHKNLRTWQVRAALRKRTFTFDKVNFRKWLLVNFKIDRLPDVHIVDRYMEAVRPLGVENDGQGLDYFFPKNFRPSPDLPFAIRHLPFITFAIGAAHQTKRLPTGKIIEICRRLKMPVVLLGGKAEFAEGEKVAAGSGGHVTNTCGKMGLHESAALIRAAHKVITHDTGMMHIAAALQKETLSIWGSTVPAFGMVPYFGETPVASTRFEVPGLGCRPCSKIGFRQCPKGHFNCMKGQDVEAIVRQVEASKTK